MNRQWTSRKEWSSCRPNSVRVALSGPGTWITIIILFTVPQWQWVSLVTSCYILLPLVVMRGLENWSAKALALGCHFANITILGTLPVVVSLAILVVCLGRGTFSTKECWVFSALLAVSRGKPFVEFLSSLFCSQCFNTFGSWVLCWVRSAWLPNSI